MERKFFSIVRIIGSILASIALLVVIGGIIMAYDQYSDTANVNMETPKVEFSDFEESQKKKEVVKKEISKNITQVNEAPEDVFQKKFEKYMKIISDNINQYALKYNVDTLNDQGARNYFNEKIESYDDTLKEAYMSQFADLTVNLLASPNIKNTPNGLPMSWMTMLDWFEYKFNQKITEEENRIQNEQLEAAASKVNSLETLTIVGGALIVFLFFTMVLVLLRIESNTRAKIVPALE